MRSRNKHRRHVNQVSLFMSLLDKIQYIFRRKKTDTPAESPIDEPVLTTIDALGSVEPSPSFYATNSPTISHPNQPDWLINEDILRDEGVIFGLSASNPDDKIAIIRSYFLQQTAEVEKLIEYREERIGELNYWTNEKQDAIKEIERKIDDLKNREFTEQHHLLRTTVGISLAIGISVGNYFLIEESLAGHFVQHKLIALGVFLAGMFNLFGRISFLHDDNRQSSWRKLLEEIGMPLAAAFFVFAQIYPKSTALEAWSALGFIFFLFMFAGKLLLGNLTVLKEDLSIFQKRNQLQKDKVKKVADWEREITQHKQEIDKHRVEKQQILEELSKYIAEKTRFQAQRDMLIKVFESEYALASQYRHRITQKDLRSIIDNNSLE